MKSERIAVIGFAVIIIVALSFFILTQENPETEKIYLDDILENLFGQSKQSPPSTIEEGDCVDLNYIGKYANGTVFDSSYADPEQKTDGTPINVYVTGDINALPPSGYELYTSGMIEGFLDGIIGLKEGEEVTIGPIPPEEGYGNKVNIGDTFSTQQIMMNTNIPSQSINTTVEVTNLTSEYLSLRWINPEDFDKFTMPEGILYDLNSLDQNDWFTLVPPHYLWENSTEIIEINQDSIVVETTPTKTENISDEMRPIQYGNITTFIFPDATTVNYDDETITISNNPELGKSYEYIIAYYGMEIITNITVVDIDFMNDTINISVTYEGYTEEPEYSEINKTIVFDREYTINRNYTDIPLYYASVLFGEDLDRKGLSLSDQAGETLYFDVVIEKVYKTSDSNSTDS
jgi:FKBP-type peptidyl-prolyl cis-trans isomerase 2